MKRRKKEEKSKVVTPQVPNEELYAQLNHKSQDYFFNLNRTLSNYGMDKEDIDKQLNGMMTTLLAEEDKGTTARQMYGTVRDQARFLAADYVSEKTEHAIIEKDMEVSEDWKLYLDGALFIGGVYSLLTGLTHFVTDNSNQVGIGWITLILNFLLGGFVVLAISKNAPKQGQKGGFFRYFVVSFVSILLWVLVMGAITAFIPQTINVMVPGWLVLIIGAVALLAKWYLKKRLNIKGGMF